ncbi:hypothetical protein [Eggerthella lenta]|uniref:hypothetical protein n=1 Tax=Eggerthella lenta TaxID=84112 RepID=UPI001FCA636E|nr:hypothetical protein [Eggerthella lenta]BDF41390.1 hypothetical protein CE91St33_14520 [Eggerthella lenta]
MVNKNEVAARIMEHLCNHDGNGGHGYTQGNRWGDGTYETVTIDGVGYQVANGDRDCSSAVISAYTAAGVDCGGATYTGNMKNCMCGTGNFEWKPMSYIAQRGDIYLNEANHTAMCTSAYPDMLAQFSISENNTIYGQQGDQTGWESSIKPYYDYPWDCILHYVGEGGGVQPPSGYLPDLRYRVKTAQAGWLPEMVNWSDSGPVGDDYAGNVGQPITYVAMDIPDGYYQVRTEASGWLPAVSQYNIYDEMYGCAGDGSPITGIRCWRDHTKPGVGAVSVRYQVANLNSVWFTEMYDLRDSGGSGDDYAGDGGRIDRFRACFVTLG